MKKVVFCLMAVSLSGNGSAAVTMVENDLSESLTQQGGQPAQKRFKEIKSPPKQIEQLHIDGYIDKQYVRLVVDIVNDKQVSGYLFENKGVKQYVYGEKINGVLHIYDPGGRHLTVVLDNK